MSACSQFSVLIGGWHFAGNLMHMVTDAGVCHAQANQQWFFCVFCTCLSMLLTNDKLHFSKYCFWLFVQTTEHFWAFNYVRPKKVYCIQTSSQWAEWLLILSINIAEMKWAKTYYFHPKWEEDQFLFILIQKLFVWSCLNAMVALTKEGSLEQHFKTWQESC